MITTESTGVSCGIFDVVKSWMSRLLSVFISDIGAFVHCQGIFREWIWQRTHRCTWKSIVPFDSPAEVEKKRNWVARMEQQAAEAEVKWVLDWSYCRTNFSDDNTYCDRSISCQLTVNYSLLSSIDIRLHDDFMMYDFSLLFADKRAFCWSPYLVDNWCQPRVFIWDPLIWPIDESFRLRSWQLA